jgi:hypothetical protein
MAYTKCQEKLLYATAYNTVYVIKLNILQFAFIIGRGLRMYFLKAEGNKNELYMMAEFHNDDCTLHMADSP